MTLGEFRKLTEQMPDDTPLKFGYADGVRNVNSFEVNGTSLVLCEGIYDQFSDSDKKCAENFGIDYLDVEDFLQTIFKEETK